MEKWKHVKLQESLTSLSDAYVGTLMLQPGEDQIQIIMNTPRMLGTCLTSFFWAMPVFLRQGYAKKHITDRLHSLLGTKHTHSHHASPWASHASDTISRAPEGLQWDKIRVLQVWYPWKALQGIFSHMDNVGIHPNQAGKETLQHFNKDLCQSM